MFDQTEGAVITKLEAMIQALNDEHTNSKVQNRGQTLGLVDIHMVY